MAAHALATDHTIRLQCLAAANHFVATLRAICKPSGSTAADSSSFAKLLLPLLTGTNHASGVATSSGAIAGLRHSGAGFGSVGDGFSRELCLLRDAVATRVAAFARPEQQASQVGSVLNLCPSLITLRRRRSIHPLSRPAHLELFIRCHLRSTRAS